MPAPARASRWSVMLAVPVGLLAVVWSARTGGYEPADWYPGVFVAAVALAVAVATGAARLQVAGRVAVGALAAYVAWSYLSIRWAAVPGDALEGSNRALLYLLVLALFAVLPWGRGSAQAAVGVLVVGVASVGLVTLARLAFDGSPAPLLAGVRLSAPMGYQNANAALWAMAAVPALLGGATLPVRPWSRGALLALSAACFQLGMLTQSRGWLVVVPVVLAGAFAAVPERRRLLMAALAVAGPTALALPWLLRVYRVGEGQPLASMVNGAGRAALLSCLAVAVVGTVGHLLALRFRPPRRAQRLMLAGAMAVVATGVTGAIVAGSPRPNTASTHFADQDPGRGDLWRVSLRLAADHPVGGIGQDNFADPLLVSRRTTVESRWAHSLPLRLLVHTGTVGLVLFASFVAACGTAAVLLYRWGDGHDGAVLAAALAPAAVWLLQGSFDWLWEFPALTVTALAGLGMVLSRAGGRQAEPAAAAEGWPGPAWAAVAMRLSVVVAIAVAVAAMTPSYLAARAVASAAGHTGGDAASELAALATARNRDPLSARPDIVAGLILLRAGDLPAAQARFESALERHPSDWFSHLAVGLVDTARGDHAEAREALKQAAALNPKDVVVQLALARLDTGAPLTFVSGREQLRPEILEMTRIGGRLDWATGAALALVTGADPAAAGASVARR